MKRILGVEKKKRIRKDVMIESELLEIMEARHMKRSDTVNVALEKYLRPGKR